MVERAATTNSIRIHSTLVAVGRRNFLVYYLLIRYNFAAWISAGNEILHDLLQTSADLKARVI